MGDAAKDKGDADDFERLTNLSEETAENWDNTFEAGESYHPVRADGERDRKLDAMANVAARPESLTETMDLKAQIRSVPDFPKPGGSITMTRPTGWRRRSACIRASAGKDGRQTIGRPMPRST